jgi:kynurenine formamidase
MSAAAEQDGNWGRWGEDDERGALNLLSPEIVLNAAQVCRTGRVYQLGLPLQREGMPNYAYRGIPQRLTLTNHTDEARLAAFGATSGVGANEDLLVFASHAVTHMDALSHVYADGCMYNGHPYDAMTSYDGASKCGIEKAGGFATRGVLVDLAGAQGVDWLEAGHVVTRQELVDALRQQRVNLQPGDAVLLRTGWLDWYFNTGASSLDSPQPGIGHEAAVFLAEQDVVAIGADNSAVEAMPFDNGEFMTAHIELLTRRGVYLLEHLDLSGLVADRCYEFMFVAGPLRITGATASPVNPVAIG